MSCNICGSFEFDYPSFRDKSLGIWQNKPNKPFRCKKCFSLERHRIIKSLYDEYSKRSADKILLLSDDPAKKYLPKHTEISIYQEVNSIDVTNINRKDKTYDIIFCHHIIEHIENDIKAFQELCRILNDNGQMYWSVPSPTILEKTKRIVSADDFYNHHRYYGKDFIETVQQWSNLFKVKTRNLLRKDPITEFEDLIFLTEKLS